MSERNPEVPPMNDGADPQPPESKADPDDMSTKVIKSDPDDQNVPQSNK